MNDKLALDIVDKIFNNVFDTDNNYSLEELLDKVAFDIKIPKQVIDSTTNEITWADSINSKKFITNENMEKRDKTILGLLFYLTKQSCSFFTIFFSSLFEHIKLGRRISL